MGLLDELSVEPFHGDPSVRLVVVDVETTGVYDSDRVVEVAAVTMSPNGKIHDE
ncbi:MAG: hypothetical protein JW990_02655 [Thermoleophilia bacterium]|nr:hypothetical protein [Thermoleophilia bacterium]